MVDDDVTELERFREALAGLSRTSVVAESKNSAAMKLLGSGSFDLVVTDLRMPLVDGLDMLRLAHSLDPDMQVVIMAGYPSVDTAIDDQGVCPRCPHGLAEPFGHLDPPL